MPLFPHSNILTDYSFLESCETPTQWAALVDDNVPLAFADHDALGGALEIKKSFKAKRGGAGVGVSVTIEHTLGKHRVRLHPRDTDGWRFVCALRSRPGSATLMAALSSPPVGVSCVIETGPDARISGREIPDETIRWLAERFGGRLFVEDWHPGCVMPVSDDPWRARVLSTAVSCGALPIATVPVRYGTPDRQASYRTLRQVLAVKTGRMDAQTIGCHLLTEEEMSLCFGAGKRASLTNAEQFAVDHAFAPQPAAPMLPSYPNTSDPDRDLVELAHQGMEKALAAGALGSGRDHDTYRARLAFELEVIRNMGFSGYFLIVAEFCRWSKDNRISVGPGRGSGAGSLVARCVGITAVDPVQYGLYFERFLNPDRISLPDFDVDFPEDRVGDVFGHIRSIYGVTHAARIANYAYLKGKSAIKDVARAVGLPFPLVNRLTQIYPDKAPTITEALRDPTFRRAVDRLDGMSDVCQAAASIEGVKRQMGLHAAGIVIAPGPVSDFAPVIDGDDGLVCTFDMKSAESVGLVKFDILSLTTLSVIDDARAEIERVGRPLPPQMEDVVPDDSLVFDMLARGRSTGVFQFDDMQDVLRMVAPKEFADLVALNALYRPGPIQQFPVYASRKQRVAAGEVVDLELPRPEGLTRAVLEETYGVMVYQEQVMEIARICGGFTLAQADMLRRAIGKKIPEEIARAKTGFIDGCIRTVEMSEREAIDLFALIERFADYGFNKAHAVAYTHVGYVTAHYKTHYPDAWLAALINREEAASRRDTVADEARSLGVEVLGPCVNASQIHCGVDGMGDRKAIRLGLGFIKGIGRSSTGPAAQIIRARRGGEFVGLDDFFCRVGKSLSSPQMTALSEAGAFDKLSDSRAAAAAYLMARAEDESNGRGKVEGQADLFGGAATKSVSSHNRLLLRSDGPDRLHLERSRLGLVVSDPDGDILLDRAHGGRVVWTLAGEGRRVQPATVAGVVEQARAELASGSEAGRAVLAAMAFDIRSGQHDASRVGLKTGVDRIEAVIGGNDRKAFELALTEAMEGRSPVLCHMEWSVGRDGQPEFRVVGLPAFADVMFAGDPADIRVKTAHQAPGGLDDLARRVMEGLQEGGAPRSPPQSKGILLLTDGTRRAVFANHWKATNEAAEQIYAVIGVREVYLGNSREVAPRRASSRTSMPSAAAE